MELEDRKKCIIVYNFIVNSTLTKMKYLGLFNMLLLDLFERVFGLFSKTLYGSLQLALCLTKISNIK